MTNSQITIYHTFNKLSKSQSIDSYNKEGDTYNDIKCDIKFKNIYFIYSTIPDISLFKWINLKRK